MKEGDGGRMPAFWDDRNGHLVTRPKQLPDVYPQLAEDWVGSEKMYGEELRS